MFIGKYDVLVNCIIELACQQLAKPTKILSSNSLYLYLHLEIAKKVCPMADDMNTKDKQ